ASGTLTAEGSLDVDSVLVRTPDGDFNVELSGDDYSRTFIAPAAGTYVISAEFVDSGHTYRAQATLSVYSAQSGSSNDGSHGYDSSWSGGAGYVKPKEEAGSPESDDGEASSSELTTEEPVIPEPEYEPLPPVEPRDAQLAPKATGVFDLGSSVKWFALLLALALVVGLGVYAYSKRKPKDDGIDWEGYFKGGA
ncbi:hypothetical protein KY319_04700, partial [Candidatus Woesearchaeota archaeon]|nr:hypothetical protein [Candidatus Woesearchaeota archaeon]